MSTRRGPGWYLEHDGGALVRGLEAQRDALALEIVGLDRLRHAETLERLERLFGAEHEITTAYRTQTPHVHRLELHCSSWPTDAEAFEFEIERERRPKAQRTPDPSALGAGEYVSRRVGAVVRVR
jgi:hypothetical protein